MLLLQVPTYQSTIFAMLRSKVRRLNLLQHSEKLDNDNFAIFVLPTLVDSDDYIYNVEDEFNGVVIEGAYYDKQFMFGKGAGGFPTGSAVLSDISARFTITVTSIKS